MAPYDWTRIDPARPMAPTRQRRDPARWLVSLLVATVAGFAAAFAVLIGYVVVITATSLDHVAPAGIGALLALGVGIAVATLAWRAIRIRWHRMPPGRETRWG